MMMIEQRGGFLYQHRPDVIPHGYQTEQELMLWVAYYEQKERERGNG
jgi:hypothetical protein